MKVSRYNFLFPWKDSTLLAYNALRNGLALVPGEVAQLLGDFSRERWQRTDSSLQQELLRGGFVVADEEDERELLLVRYRMGQFHMRALSLTLCPTLACNLACTYCFESAFRGMMDRETVDAVASFADSLLPKGGELSVTWYGGEPLLALGVIEELSEKLTALATQRQARYGASVVTNGTLLTPDVAKKLASWGVADAQVTLDGPPELHDRRRPFKDGSASSFAAIVANLPGVLEFLPVNLRVNVDRGNAAAVLDFVEALTAEPWWDAERIQVYFGYVRRYTPACGCGLEEILQPQEFFSLEEDLLQRLSTKGLPATPYPDLAGGCTATCAHAFVVGPKGELYRCWNHVGDERLVVGNVRNGIPCHPLYLRWLLASPQDDPECWECRFLPICWGGCIDLATKGKAGVAGAGKSCTRYRHFLESRLRAYAAARLATLTSSTDDEEAPSDAMA